MRWTVVIVGSVVAGALGWAAAVWPYHQDGGVAVGVAAALVTIVVTAGTKWANGDGRPPAARPPTGDDGPTAVAPLTAAGPPHSPGAAQVVVGDLPGQAVAWQDRVELLDRLTVMAGHGRTGGVGPGT